MPIRIIALLVATGLLTYPQTVPRLSPVDDTPRDSSFRSFVKKLQAAVDSHSTNALRKLVDKEVVSGPEKEDTGWDKFEARWRPDAKDSELWIALADMLSLGFVREQPNLFLSPYLVWRFPRDLDMAIHLVVIRDKAELRTEPSLKAPVAATLSFDIVEQVGPYENGEGLGQWVLVHTADGHTGYLNTRDVMSPLMPRIQIALRHGKWSIVALEGPFR